MTTLPNWKKIKEIEGSNGVQAGFWDNQEKAQEVVGQLKSVKAVVGPMSELVAATEDLSALVQMAR